jgi:hypothetical protein
MEGRGSHIMTMDLKSGLDQSATLIQKVYRGHRARKSHKRKRHRLSMQEREEREEAGLPGQVINEGTPSGRARRHSTRPHRGSHSSSKRGSTRERKSMRGEGVGDSDWSSEDEHDREMEAPHYMHAPSMIRAATEDVRKEEISLDKAIRHRHLTCPHEKLPDGSYREWPLWSSIENIRQYGLGTYMYFKMLRHMMVLFFILTVLAVPAMYFPNQSDAEILDVNYGFERTMLGNLGYGDFEIGGWNKKDIGALLSGLDAAYTLVILVFIWIVGRMRLSADAAYRYPHTHTHTHTLIHTLTYTHTITLTHSHTQEKSPHS